MTRAALAIVIAVLLLASCGHAQAQKDPFVGTWRQGRHPPRVVIAKVSGGYVATLVYLKGSARMTLARHGDELAGTLKLTTGQALRVVIDYQPATGRLRFRNTSPETGQWSSPSELSRISNGTSVAVPSPDSS